MEDLSIEEVKQLVNFYRQKASDLEFQLLQTQLKINKIVLDQKIKESESIAKSDKKLK